MAVYQTFLARCAIEKADGNGNGIPDYLEGRLGSDGTTGAGADDAKVITDTGATMLGGVSDSQLGGGGSCPTLPTFNVWGASFSFSDWSGWCDFLSILSGIVYFVGAFISLRVLMGV